MRLYVGNLPFSTDDNEMRSLFEQHGQVDSATIVTDRDTGRSRGFGFVEMSDDQAARTAIETLDGFVLDGRPLTVNEARPRREGGGGRRGGGGGGGGGGRRY